MYSLCQTPPPTLRRKNSQTSQSNTHTPLTFLTVCESWYTLKYEFAKCPNICLVSYLHVGQTISYNHTPTRVCFGGVWSSLCSSVSAPALGTDFKYLERLAECVISSHFDQQPFDLSCGLQQPSLGYFKQSTSRKRLRPH